MKSKVDRFEDLVAWQKARTMTRNVYLASRRGPLARDFSFRNQMRRAALSVPSNIAEGFERGGRAEFQHFLSIAKASCGELRTQIYIAEDVGYLDASTARELLRCAEEVGRIVGGLRAAVARQRTQSSVLSPQS